MEATRESREIASPYRCVWITEIDSPICRRCDGHNYDCATYTSQEVLRKIREDTKDERKE